MLKVRKAEFDQDVLAFHFRVRVAQ
jgi:hypothetical protein